MTDKTEKLLRKISKKDRKRLFNLVEKLVKGKQGLNVKKIKNSDFYLLKSGRFRIIFHYNKKEIIVDSIRLRNEDTYKRK